MSTTSQTSATRSTGFGRRFALRFGLSMTVVVVILVAAMGRSGAGARTLGDARLHAPDMAIWAGLSLPIKIHVLAAVAALLLGAALMVGRKGRRFHRVAGWTWVSLVSVTAGSTLFITSLNHGQWSLLHLFTAWTLLVLPFAVAMAKRRDISRHRGFMTGLFFGGFAINFFIAFIPGRAMWAMFFG